MTGPAARPAPAGPPAATPAGWAPGDGQAPGDGSRGRGVSAGLFPLRAPRQLPGPPVYLEGRDAELSALGQLLAASKQPGPRAVTISGPPGVGKTALAIWWLREHWTRYPDGQLCARLASPHGAAGTPQEVLGRWLRALGVPAAWVPAGQPDRARLWQAVTAGRRLAVVIDDAPSAAAAAALLPGAGPAIVLITSRRALAAGPGSGLGQLRLRPLRRAAAARLLAREMAAANRPATAGVVRELARVSGGLPVALRCAAQLTAHGAGPLASLAERMKADQATLAAQGVPRAEAQARAVIAAVSRELEPEAARAWRLLCLCPGPEVSVSLAACVLRISPEQARALLKDLARAGLLEAVACGWGQFHDLIQQAGRDQAVQDVPVLERHAVSGRALTWYATEAVRRRFVLSDASCPQQGIDTTYYLSPAQVVAATERQQPAMIAALREAAARGDHARAIRLAGTLWPLLEHCGGYDGQLAAARLGVLAARADGDAPAEAGLLTGAGRALRGLGRAGQAAVCFRRAAWIWSRLGYDDQLADALRELGHATAAMGYPAAAIRHLSQALDLYQRGTVEQGIVCTLIGLGEALTATGHQAAAVARLRQARKLLATQPDLYLEARARAAAGIALARYPDAAATHLTQALKAMRKLHRLPEQATILAALGDLAAQTGRLTVARRRYRQALAMLPGTHPATARVRSQLSALTARPRNPTPSPEGADHD
jgi:tetratricopeptide (TPR) repeat protein